MCKRPILQAHKGVDSEYPENTMSAFEAAVLQGYGYIELDPNYTSDNKIVVLHDRTINRTARNNDGTTVEQEINISDITYDKALEFDFGLSFSPRFKGEKLPLLEQILSLAKENDIKIKLDSKIELFSPAATENLYSLIKEYEDIIGITSANPAMIEFYAEKFPKSELHYDGAVNDEVLNRLSVFGKRLTVWLPYESPMTSWVCVPFANEELCNMVKKYAKLGIWIINDYESYNYICKHFAPDIVETKGIVKPEINEGYLCDMHTHSRNSHDSEAIISKTAQSAQEKGISAIAVTDHCDIQYFIDRDMRGCIRNSVAETEQAAKEFNGSPMILKGVEIGEGLWNEKYAYEISMQSDYDVIIGSVHAVRYKEIDIPYSCIDFSQMTDDEIDEYLNIYFDDVLAMLNMGLCDVMAHLTCPLRYINGKYKRNVSSRRYEEKIVAILKYVIENAIALEINTSGIGTGLGLLMPDEWIIEKFKDMGGYLITLGSDTHISQNVGNGFGEALDILKKYGFVNCYYYKDRKNIQYTI